jgi:hypothetical protein
LAAYSRQACGAGIVRAEAAISSSDRFIGELPVEIIFSRIHAMEAPGGQAKEK